MLTVTVKGTVPVWFKTGRNRVKHTVHKRKNHPLRVVRVSHKGRRGSRTGRHQTHVGSDVHVWKQ